MITKILGVFIILFNSCITCIYFPSLATYIPQQFTEKPIKNCEEIPSLQDCARKIRNLQENSTLFVMSQWGKERKKNCWIFSTYMEKGIISNNCQQNKSRVNYKIRSTLVPSKRKKKQRKGTINQVPFLMIRNLFYGWLVGSFVWRRINHFQFI